MGPQAGSVCSSTISLMGSSARPPLTYRRANEVREEVTGGGAGMKLSLESGLFACWMSRFLFSPDSIFLGSDSLLQ